MTMRLDCTDSFLNWYEETPENYHPIALATVRCHVRLDDPTGPSFSTEGDEVWTVPGRYCGRMFKCFSHDPPERGIEWGRSLVGRLVEK